MRHAAQEEVIFQNYQRSNFITSIISSPHECRITSGNDRKRDRNLKNK